MLPVKDANPLTAVQVKNKQQTSQLATHDPRQHLLMNVYQIRALTADFDLTLKGTRYKQQHMRHQQRLQRS